MSKPRVEALIARLEKGKQKSHEILSGLTADQWRSVVYTDPCPWTVRDLLAHFVSAEEVLLRIAQDVASGGAGAPEGFDYDAFNAEEQKRLADRSPHLKPRPGPCATVLPPPRGNVPTGHALSSDMDRCTIPSATDPLAIRSEFGGSFACPFPVWQSTPPLVVSTFACSSPITKMPVELPPPAPLLCPHPPR